MAHLLGVNIEHTLCLIRLVWKAEDCGSAEIRAEAYNGAWLGRLSTTELGGVCELVACNLDDPSSSRSS